MLLVAIVLRTIDAIGTFDQIYVLTQGGPGVSTRLISIYAYNTAFLFTQYGQAAAMLIALLAMVMLLMLVAVRHAAKDGPVSGACPGSGSTPLIALILAIAIFPFWWMLDTSLKQPVDIFGGVTLYPHHPTTSNYSRLFNTYHFGSYLRTA